MEKKILIIISTLVCICIIIAYLIYPSVIYYNSISMNELRDDFHYKDEGGGYFETYDHLDVVYVKDVILDMELTSSGETVLWFESVGKQGFNWTIFFNSDLSSGYDIGDKVLIEILIVEFEIEGIKSEYYGKLSQDKIRHVWI